MLQTLSYKIGIAPGGLPTRVMLSQNENGRQLQFDLRGTQVNIPSGSVATISGTKPDGVVYSAEGTLSGTVATFAEDTQMTAAAGEWEAKIRVTYGGQVIASERVWMIIDRDPVEAGSVPSESELNGLVAEAQQYVENARSAAYGSPLTAATAAAMVDVTKVYVYTGSESGMVAGHWYYYDGSAWQDGGVYQSQGTTTDTTLSILGMPADAKATGDALATKVPAETGKGLSTNDYTTADKEKLAGIEAEATRTTIDATLTQTGQAADAKKTGDEIGDLKNALNQNVDALQSELNTLDKIVNGGTSPTPTPTPALTWELGSINSSGADTSHVRCIRTNGYVSGGSTLNAVVNNTGINYTLGIYCYNSESVEGYLSFANLFVNKSSGTYTLELESGKYYRFVLTRSTGNASVETETSAVSVTLTGEISPEPQPQTEGLVNIVAHKLDSPESAGVAGQVLTLTAEQKSIWADPVAGTIDTALSNTSLNPVQNKAIGSVMLGDAVIMPLEWETGTFDASTGEEVTGNRYARTTEFVAGQLQRIKFKTVSTTYRPQIWKYKADGTFIGYEQLNGGTEEAYVHILKNGEKYRFGLYKTTSGTIDINTAVSESIFEYKTPLSGNAGLLLDFNAVKEATESIDKTVNGGGERIVFNVESGTIDTTTGEDKNPVTSPRYGRTIDFWESDGDYLLFESIPVGERVVVYEYDEQKQFVSYLPHGTNGIEYASCPYTLQTTSGHYYRFQFGTNSTAYWNDPDDFVSGFVVYKLSTFVTGLTKRVAMLEQQSGSDKIFTGKICVTLGDSITYRNVWQPVVNEALGMTMINKGIGSTTLGGSDDTSAMCSVARLNGVLAESPDFVTILGGANDLTTTMEIGTEEEFSKQLASKDRNTFIGAYSYIIEYLLGQDPTLSIMILGTTWAHNDGTKYSQTKTYTQYSEASRKVAQYYGLPFVDLHGQCGFNAFTLGTAAANQIYSIDQIHPNAEGGKRIASLVIAKMIEAWKYTI